MSSNQFFRGKGYTIIRKTLQRKQNIEPHEEHWKPGLKSGAPGGHVVSTQIVEPRLVTTNKQKLLSKYLIKKH